MTGLLPYSSSAWPSEPYPVLHLYSHCAFYILFYPIISLLYFKQEISVYLYDSSNGRVPLTFCRNSPVQQTSPVPFPPSSCRLPANQPISNPSYHPCLGPAQQYHIIQTRFSSPLDNCQIPTAPKQVLPNQREKKKKSRSSPIPDSNTPTPAAKPSQW